MTASRAHPRSRGENAIGRASGARPAGASPLTRGKRLRRRSPDPRGWRIPAHAGKTTTVRLSAWSQWAHPRSRGENVSAKKNHRAIAGASPLTRGKRSSRPCETLSSGRIPAHAGKTSPLSTPRQTGRAHPRSRGENFGPISGRGLVPGASPLTRGKLLQAEGHALVAGRIPAHAGKTMRATPV